MAAAVLALLAVPALAAEPGGSADQAAPSVLVHVEAPRQGTLPDRLVAYGTAAPALDGGMTLSLPQDGRVLSIAVTPGEQVRAGARLVEFAASAGTSSAWQQAGTALALARTQRGHAAQLLAQQLATRDQLAQADKAVSDAQEVLDTLAREGANRPRTALEAPFDGIVGTIAVTQGERVAAGAALMTLTRLDGLVVTVGIEPDRRARVHRGQAAQLWRLDGGEARQGTEAGVLHGQVLRVDGALNPRTRLVDCDIGVPTGSVLSGEGFRTAITVGSLAGWLVPRDAVIGAADGADGAGQDAGAHLFQVDGERAVAVAVRVLGSAGQTDVVTGDLQPGRGLVVTGAPQLSGGSAVRSAP